MKIIKKYKYDYEANGITEENGYVKWHFWEKVKMPVRITGVVLVAILFILSRLFKDELMIYGKTKTVIAAFLALATLLIIVVPVHEIIHLLVMSKGKLDDKCIITAGGGAVSAAYNGHVSRNRYLVCLVAPFAFFVAVFILAALLTNGIIRVYFFYLVVMSCLSSYTDIYMIFLYTLYFVHTFCTHILRILY